MKNLKLNENLGKTVIAHGYELDLTEQYCICIEDELSNNKAFYPPLGLWGSQL